jgi:hypothetical protein
MDVITHPTVSRLEAKNSKRAAPRDDKSFCVVGKSVAADVSHEID